MTLENVMKFLEELRKLTPAEQAAALEKIKDYVKQQDTADSADH